MHGQRVANCPSAADGLTLWVQCVSLTTLKHDSLVARIRAEEICLVASLSVIQGADQGKRFEFMSSPLALGRDSSNAIRLQDTEISRRHAELRLDRDGYRVVDLQSANGTFVNGKAVDQSPLHSGDRLQLGQTVMLFHEGSVAARRDLIARVDLLAKSSPDDRSAILKSIPSDEGSRVLKAPDATAGWLRERLLNLSVMYRATQAISDILDIDALTPLILDLVFESIGADRGAILLKDESGVLLPKAVRWRDGEQPDERMSISQTIVDYVLEQGQGVITSDAPTDKRFSTAKSVVDLQIREAICVPIQGRHTTLGVIYADIQAGRSRPARRAPPGAAVSARNSSCSWSPSVTRPGWRSKTPSSTTTRSRPSDSPRSARRSPPSLITSKTSSRAFTAAAR